MGNPRIEYSRYEERDGEKMLNGDGNGNDIPTPDSPYYHPYLCPNIHNLTRCLQVREWNWMHPNVDAAITLV